MLRQSVHDFLVDTRGRGFYEITREVAAWIRKTGYSEGLLTLHIRHTSASLLIQENADPEVRRDLERFMERLIPDGDTIFQHTEEGDDDMPAHVRAAITPVQLTIPVSKGGMLLGMWQGIYVWEHRRLPHARHVAAHLIGD